MFASMRRQGAATSWRAWLPARMREPSKERWRAALGAGIGILVVALICRWLHGWAGFTVPWLVAPLGASAVLVFAVPASPLAQPWSVVGGNTVSALVGIACAHWVADPALAGALAVAVAIALMFLLRCLHPPGGAMALLTAMAGPASFGFAAFPALADSLLLVVAGVAYNRATGRSYPHVAHPPGALREAGPRRFTDADLDAVLERYDEVLDISRDDLAALLHAAEGRAYQRRFGEIRCADIMTRDVATALTSTSLADAWWLMRQRKVKALPVVDASQQLLGIVTMADFLDRADLEAYERWPDRLRDAFRVAFTSKPTMVGQIMSRQVRVASADRPVAELVPLFADAGHHHIPVVGAGAKLLGIVTQRDVVSALARAV